MTPLLVRDYMSTTVNTLNDDARLLDAALLMRRTGRRHIPIVSSEGKIVGLLTDRDLRLLTPSALTPVSLEEQNKIFAETPISSAMTKTPITVLPDTTMQHALSLMQSRRIQCVLVEEKDKLCGILTVSDVLRLACDLLEERNASYQAVGM
jgi:acetoin utilization protein AcuB